MSSFQLPPETQIGFVHLRVSNLARSLEFYQNLLGFRIIAQGKNIASLSASESSGAQIRLTEIPNGVKHNPRSPGLYHIAIRVPDRKELAKVLHRFFDEGWPIEGFANHGVSEAVYLNDAEGNGIEIYCDAPRERWPRLGEEIAMISDPLDVDGLLNQYEKSGQTWNGIHPETVIGHIHLQVSDLKKSELFYSELLGFDVTQRSFPGALFVSAGGYHHHVGMNIWRSRKVPPPPSDSLGLVAFSIKIPNRQSVESIRERLVERGFTVAPTENGFETQDSDRIRIRLEE